ncbi:MAG: 3-phosphoshikimate 1-carboxyvinyltransferase [bacterium]
MKWILHPARKIYGSITLPGDKSISHRALMLSAIADGTSTIENLSDGLDVANTALCLQNLGIQVHKTTGRVSVFGQGLCGLEPPLQPLDVGNSGTTMRLLAGILAGQSFESVLTGDASIRRRPMARIIEPLQKMGAGIATTNGEHAPIHIHGRALQAIRYPMPVASAQVKSCVLFAGLYADGTTEVIEPCATRDHTERMLHSFGANIRKKGDCSSVQQCEQLKARDLFVPGDLSSAVFFIAAALMLPGSELHIKEIGLNPTRTAFLSTLIDMGAKIEIMNVINRNGELTGDLVVKHSDLTGKKIDDRLIPQLIDEIPILAVLASQAQGTTELRNAQELRFKESDRLDALSRNLSKMGVELQELEDGLIIHGPAKLNGAEIDSFGDHRIAMAFSIAALISEKETTLKDAECVSVSCPRFFNLLENVTVG